MMSKRIIDELLEYINNNDYKSLKDKLKDKNICLLIHNDFANTYDVYEPEYYQNCIKLIKSLDFECFYLLYNTIASNNYGYLLWARYVDDEKLFILAKKVSNTYNTRDYRHILQILEYNKKFNNMLTVEKIRKEYIDNEVVNYRNNQNMLTKIYKLYCLLSKMNKESLKQIDIQKLKDKYYVKLTNETTKELKGIIENYELEKMKVFFQKLSRIELSNLVIDYHFESQPYDVLIDIEEMIRYQKNGNQVLTDEDIRFYNTILKIDRLTYDELVKIHDEMKLKDIKAKFYYDYRKTIDDQYKDIRNSILNEKTIKQYYEANISKKYNVPVYYINGDRFYALVKTIGNYNFEIDKNNYFKNTAGLPSFSITSHLNLNTYTNPNEKINLIFSDFNPDQVYFTYPCDAGTECDILSGEKPTNNVNKIYTKDELTIVLSNYNQILYRSQIIDYDSELNHKLKCPKVLGVYAYDDISLKTLEFAKEYNLPIVLINTQKYKIENYEQMDFASFVDNDDYLNYTYDVYMGIDVENIRRKKVLL